MIMFIDILRQILVRSHIIRKPQLTIVWVDKHPTPSELMDGTIVVVRGATGSKWACFRCPGGCGSRFQLPLNPTRRPSWSISSDWLNRATLSPSVRQTNACRAHFIVEKGDVHWCSDSGPHAISQQ